MIQHELLILTELVHLLFTANREKQKEMFE